ncbi:MAG: Aryl-phospho-beta-D-glucosidase BglC, GH1 family [Chloroflexi bacterium AL-W]|nr:Aryl-phospho-beta-D-glucosidase BglC, GH1 family [Chloroflexi bacterium AL-N1]NOK66528.1 Aryl-phospho-beta-D-glucosidase BglC, GH1 family [Chloroflexi bacterium AL-N10]NOK71916.1 Aryl-phospho-beta-D-glucosidase BglC, GH1 family [Chloroflexi bacterium AL-N5]NOK81173.1 Aryl-phospho-beta-D-glucosidase BglC, GH1 family [Chloroflexi bacterium AL-W]NOK89446.1 Aryl-phospho-beta-D-glucosidase BglC, GH1 family [Chloroflexi bacterium AL-N15]
MQRYSIIVLIATIILISIMIGAIQPSVSAASDQIIYDDTLASGWQNWSWNTSIDLDHTGTIHTGSKAIAITYNNSWGAASFRAGSPINTSDYTALAFWVHGGLSGSRAFNVSVQTSDSGGESTQIAVDAASGKWQQISIPLSELGRPSAIARVNLQDRTGRSQPTFYIDDIHLSVDGASQPTPDPIDPTPISPPPSDQAHFYVDGRHLYDHCGERVVLRGVNKMVYWMDIDGVPSYQEIAKTGANVVRIQWLTSGSSADLDVTITNAMEQQLIPMVELHDATGDWSKLQMLVDYWKRDDVRTVLQKHKAYLLLNLGNEVGDWQVTPEQFRSGYTSAIQQLRDAGLHMPLVIDSMDWGKNIDMLQSEGPALIQADPDRNILFSVHMWWPEKSGYTSQKIIDEMNQSANQSLPLIIGEFGNKWEEGAGGQISYKTILTEAQKLDMGWIAWSWGPGNTPQTFLDMTEDGYYNTLHDWGLEVAVTHPASIKNTSVRPYSIVHGTCQ